MIKNNEYYQINGSLISDFGEEITNPIIKISVISTGVTQTGLLNCEYNVYFSAENYEKGKFFFQAEKEGERLINFTFPISEVPNWGFQTYKEDQRKIIADTFDFDLDKVTLVEEV